MTTATTTATTRDQERTNSDRDTTTTRVGFRRTLAAEWIKLGSLRSTWIALALSVVLSTGAAMLLGASIGSVWASEHSMLGGFDPIVWPLDGMFFGTIVLAVLGVNVAAGEYSSGMIRLTLAATPRRGEVLLAKIAVVAAVSLVAGFVATFAMFLGAQAVYAAYGVPTASLSDPDALRAGLSCAALTVVFPVLGVAAGILLRSTAGAITLVLALRFVPDFFGGLLPASWQEHVLSLLPSKASQALIAGHVMPNEPTFQDPVTAIAILLLWLVAASAAAFIALRTRDA